MTTHEVTLAAAKLAYAVTKKIYGVVTVANQKEVLTSLGVTPSISTLLVAPISYGDYVLDTLRAEANRLGIFPQVSLLD